ncbi:MAG: S8 family serine peptidase [Dehalococcoidia bacterium]
MRPQVVFLCFALAFAWIAPTVRLPSSGQAAEPESGPVRLIVAYQPGPNGAMMSPPAGLAHRVTNGSVTVFDAPSGGGQAALKALRADPRVRHVEIDQPIEAHVQPNDLRYSDQWALAKVGAPTAWNVVTGTRTITVAVIDSGVDLTHPEFAGRILPGWNFVAKDGNANDDYGHGTHVAGIIAAAGNNKDGIAGMAWGVTILPLKVLNASGAGYGSDLILAIDYARERGAKIVNISLGSSGASTLLQEALDRANAAGILVIASAGNTGASGNAAVYPGASPSVLAVGATDSNDKRAGFSTSGSYVDVSAPGVGIISTYRNGGYLTMSGTSMAAPMVAGLAALIWSRTPTMTAAQVRQAILDSSLELGTSGVDDEYGAGRIDAATWARRATGLPLLDPTPTPTAAPRTPTPAVSPTASPTPTRTPVPAYPSPARPGQPSGAGPRSTTGQVFLPITSWRSLG